MHVEKRVLGRKVKYFLSHSYREGANVHKFRKYLGQDLKPELLEERKKIAEKLILEEIFKYNIIKDPLQIEFSKEEIDSIKKLETQIPLNVKHLSEKDWKMFSELFTYNTNAIEGSKLNQNEVNELLEKDKWPDKSKEDIAETFGVDNAISYIRKTKEHISLELIKNTHKIIFKNSKSFAGNLRKKGEEVVVMDSERNIVHEGAPQTRVIHLLNELIKWYENNSNKYPGLILGAVVHNQFENIHPFRDGNGRVGRLLLNFILLKKKYPPISITLEDRAEYYATLQEYQKNQNLKPAVEFLVKQYRKTLRKVTTKSKRI